MRNRKSIDALALGVCIIAATVAALSIWHLPPRADVEVAEEIGRTMAREALAVLPKDGRVVVIARDLNAYEQPAMEISLEEFESEIEKAGASVVMRPIELDPLRPVEVPPGDFYEAIRRAKTNDVIVSFLGPPVLAPEQHEKLPALKPKIIALCTGSLAAQTDLAALSRLGLLHAGIVNRAKSKEPKKIGATLSFEQLYAVVREGQK
jgi:hypothetical protein